MKFREFIGESINTIAFWITPKGQIIGGMKNHITMVIQNPEKFGLTFDYIKQRFDEYGEKMGQEGKAREEIIMSLLEQGFVRIRKYGNMGWIIDILSASKHLNKEYVTQWANQILTKGISGIEEYDTRAKVTIVDLGSYKRTMTIGQLADRKLYEEFNYKPRRATLKVVTDPKHLYKLPIWCT